MIIMPLEWVLGHDNLPPSGNEIPPLDSPTPQSYAHRASTTPRVRLILGFEKCERSLVQRNLNSHTNSRHRQYQSESQILQRIEIDFPTKKKRQERER